MSGKSTCLLFLPRAFQASVPGGFERDSLSWKSAKTPHLVSQERKHTAPWSLLSRAGAVPHTQVIVNPLTFAHGDLHAFNTFPVIAVPGKGQGAPPRGNRLRSGPPPASPACQPPLSLPFRRAEANLKGAVEAEVG